MNLLRSLAVAAAVPALVSMAVGAGLYAYISVTEPPVAQTVGEAVRQGSLARLVDLVLAGADPKAPVEVRLRGVAGGRLVRLTPLSLAAARDDDDALLVLTRTGIAWSEDEKRAAACLALAMEHQSVARRLSSPIPTEDECRDRVERLPRG